MAFCNACGKEIGSASFCSVCGANQGGVPATPAASASASSGLEENVAGLLCYAFLWLGGLIFLLIDKRPSVRFHGAQSIAFSIAIIPIWILYFILNFVILAITAAIGVPGLGLLAWLLTPVLAIALFGTWIFLMVKAYNLQKYKLPIIGNLCEKMVGA